MRETRKFITILVSFILLFNVVSLMLSNDVARANSLVEDSWYCFGGNAKRTGLSPANTEDVYGGIKWTRSIRPGSISSPIIDSNGTIYLSTYGELIALNPDGTDKWTCSYLTPNTEGVTTPGPTPALGPDGTIYYAPATEELNAIDHNGNVKWTYETNDLIYSSPVVDSDGVVYFGSMDHNFYALNPTGTLKWKYTTGGEIHSAPAIDDDGTIYFTSGDGLFYALNSNGTLKWSYDSSAELCSPTVDDDGTIYAILGGWSGGFYAFNPDGTQKWMIETEYGIGFGYHPSIGANGIIYTSGSEKLYAISKTGEIIWEDDDGGGARAVAIGSDGTIYLSGTDVNVYAFTADGNTKWKSEFSSGQKTTPAIGPDGTVYYINGDSSLIAYKNSMSPTKPLHLMATTEIKSVNLTWGPPSEGSVIGYYVYRHESSSIDIENTDTWHRIIESREILYFIDSTITNSSEGYYYTVTAYNNYGQGEMADMVYVSTYFTIDFDLDNLLDDWEESYFGNLTYGPGEDTDNDGFTNLQEFEGSSDPSDKDKTPDDWDGDGITNLIDTEPLIPDNSTNTGDEVIDDDLENPSANKNILSDYWWIIVMFVVVGISGVLWKLKRTTKKKKPSREEEIITEEDDETS